MRQHMTLSLLLFGLLLSPVSSQATAPANQFLVTGAVAKPGSWTAASLAKEFASSVKIVHYVLKGSSHTAHCIPLLAVLQEAHVQINPNIKHHELQFIVIVQGQDGYTADLSLAELLPEYGNHPVWVALDKDGAPLPAGEGPSELLVPEDVKPARWVHGLATIRVVDMSLMSQPGHS